MEGQTVTAMQVQQETLGAKVQPVLEEAKALKVHTTEEMSLATEKVKGIKGLKSEIETFYKPLKEKAHEAHKALCEAEKKHLAPLVEAQKIYEGKLKVRLDEIEDAERREAERRAEEERKAHEARVKKAIKKVEDLLTKSGDLQQQIETLRKELENPELTEDEGYIIRTRLEVLEAQYNKAVEKVEEKKAEIEEPTFTAPLSGPSPTSGPKKVAGVSGMSTKMTYKVEVVNPKALLKAIIEGFIGIEAVSFNIPVLNKIASTGVNIPGTNKIPNRKLNIK